MKDLRKLVPPKREILKGIWLSFYPGAKIGVLGNNGAGKSTLLKIMAGVDKDFEGEATPMRRASTSATSPQEPQLNPDQDRASENGRGRHRRDARLAAAASRSGWTRCTSSIGLEDADFDKLARRAGSSSRPSSRRPAQRRGSVEHQLEIAAGRAALPARRRRRRQAVRRREAPRRAVPPAAVEKPDMLLLDEPTNHLDAESVAWLEQHLAKFKGTVVADHPRSLLPRQRREVDPRTRSRRGPIPYEGNYSTWLEQKAKRLAAGAASEDRPPARERWRAELEWVRSERPRAARPRARRA